MLLHQKFKALCELSLYYRPTLHKKKKAKLNKVLLKMNVFCIAIFVMSHTPLTAQVIESLPMAEITFSKQELVLKDALNELNNHADINLVFNSNEDFLKSKISFRAKKLKLTEAFKEIQDQAPVTFVRNKNHIIVKERKLEKSYLLKGKVIDALTKEELVAAQIYIPGTTKGIITQADGSFEISLKPGQYLFNIRYLGYKEQGKNISLFQDKSITINMQPQDQKLKEVNVTDKKYAKEAFEVGRPIETIDARKINTLNTNDVNDALLGSVKGVWVTKMSGAPGDHNKIRIRGISSIFGSTDPLYVVDGMVIPTVNMNSMGIANLNTHDIESIVVLKDASSTALYGYLGGNGVILIETKKGSDESAINFSMKQGIQSFNKRYNLLNSKEFISTLEQSDELLGTQFFRHDEQYEFYELYPRYADTLGNTLGNDDFQDEIFNLGTISEYQLSGKGNFKTVDYYISGNYYDHKGVVNNTNYKKLSAMGSFKKSFKKKLVTSLIYRVSRQENHNNLDNFMSNDLIFKGINFEPAYRTTPDSFLVKPNRLFYNNEVISSGKTLANANINPDYFFNKQYKNKTENIQSTTFNAKYQITNNISANALYSFSHRNINFSSYLPSGLNAGNPDFSEKYLNSKEYFTIFSQQYDLNYTKQVKDHNINAFIKYRNYQDNVHWKIDSTTNINIDEITEQESIYMRGSMAIYNEKGSVLRSINSFIFNLNYNFKQRYYFSILGNYDNLKEGHYVNVKDFFPSIAACWDLSNEPWIPFPKWIQTFKLNANYGQVGNYPLNSLSNDLYNSTEYVSNGNPVNGVSVANFANHHLKHEQVNEYNFGTQISLFNDRIIFNADYYEKYNKNLLLLRAIPSYYGSGFFYENIGEMKSTGVEFSMELTPIVRKDFYWTTKIISSKYKQRITKLLNGNEINFNNSDVLFPDFYARENEELGLITGYDYRGNWNDLSLEQVGSGNYVADHNLAYSKIDSLNKNKLTEDDKAIIGNTIPKLNISWINMLEYKNFSCEMLWYGSFGFDKYNATKASTYMTGLNSEVKDIVSRSVNYHTDEKFYESSFFVEDASFIKLKTLSFSYSPTKKIYDKFGYQLTLSFENLLTLTKYSGYDPEATVYTNNNFTDNAIDRGSYPNPKGVFFTINLKL